VSIGDVIQLSAANDWGPLLCTVTEVKTWGVQCFALIPEAKNVTPDKMFLRVENKDFQRIGDLSAEQSKKETPK
jgi:hypothetical protein